MRQLKRHELPPNIYLYDRRCKCKEEKERRKLLGIEEKPKPKAKNRCEALPYPDPDEIQDRATFQIKYEKKLSPIAKLLFSSFKYKYLFYAIDDILYLLKTNPIERDNLLAILYSPIISLQNNLSINFFDIWVGKIYINEPPKINKFLTNDPKIFEEFSYITIDFFYKTRLPIKKKEPLW
jgi:hypothetical protein